ncbi:MAG: RICIN domain-containing protein [Spirochaetes bacterium]|nr:RICIN domain-containing protein [Spirochaetota bacterium]
MGIKKVLTCLTISVFISVLSGTAVLSVSANDKFDAPPVDGIWLIKSVQNGQSPREGYWDQPGKEQYYKNGANIQTWTKEPIRAGNDQNYHFVDAYDGFYSIASMNGDGFVGVDKGKNADGVAVKIFSPDNTAAQKFRFKHMGGGRYKIYTAWFRVLATTGKSVKNGTKIITMMDDGSRATEWYFENVNTGKNYIPGEAQVNSKKEAELPDFETVINNLKNNAIVEQYFKAVTAERFNTDNASGDLQNELNTNPAGDQWSILTQLIPVVQKNKDINAKRNILNALSQIVIKPGKGFAETALKGPIKSSILKDAEKETDAASKKYIEAIAGKF